MRTRRWRCRCIDSSPDRHRQPRRTPSDQRCSSFRLHTVWPPCMIRRCSACPSTCPHYSRQPPRTGGSLGRNRCFRCIVWRMLFPCRRMARTLCSKPHDTSPSRHTFARSSPCPPCRRRQRIPCHLATDDSPRCHHMFHLAHMYLPDPVCSRPSELRLRGPESSTQHCPSGCRSCTCSCKPSRSRRHPHKSHARTGWPACKLRQHRDCLRRPALGTSYQARMYHLARRRPQHRAEAPRLAPLRQPSEHRVAPAGHRSHPV